MNDPGSQGFNKKGVQIETDKHMFTINDDQKKETKKPEGDRQFMMELQVNLPTQTLLECIELKFNPEHFSLFQKYLKISGLTRSSVIRPAQIDRDGSISQDIQMTMLSPQARRGDTQAENKRKK